MSKKSAAYEVRENMASIERARAQAWEEAHTLEAQLLSLEARIEEAKAKYGPDLFGIQTKPASQPKKSCALSEIETYVTTLRAQRATVEGQLGRAIATAETRLLLNGIAARTGGRNAPCDNLSSEPDHYSRAVNASRPRPASQHDRVRRKEDVIRLISRLSTLVPAERRRDLERLAIKIVQEADAGRAESLSLELRLCVQRENNKAEETAREAERAAMLRARLRGLDGKDVIEVTQELMKVEEKKIALSDALVRRVGEVEQMARMRANQRYAAAVIREELQHLGYEVLEEFDSLFVKGGKTLLHKAGAEDYRVLFEVEPTTGRIHGQLARFAQPGEVASQQQQVRDKEKEEEWCQDFARLREETKRRHVAIRVVQRVDAGSQPLQIIDLKESESRQRRRTISLMRPRM